MKWLRALWRKLFYEEVGRGSMSTWVVGKDGKPMCIDSEETTHYRPRFTWVKS